MPREKYNLIQELQRKNAELKGRKRLSLVGQGDFSGSINVTRGAMNIKHKTQHLTIDDPEFPFMFDGKENVIGENSSFYTKTDREYEVIAVCKKYNELMKGRTNIALYFLYCKHDDSYKLVERQECENLTENFGFDYRTDYLDQTEVGDIIPPDTMLISSTSYDDYGNVSVGINGRILFGVHPAVQDDAIIVSESFSKKGVINNVNITTIPVNNDTVLLNLYADENNDYVILPDIGTFVNNGIIAATRTVKETRMFSDLRDASLKNINIHTDQPYYGNGEVIDINVYCNDPNIKVNKVNRQLVQYYNDCRWFYTDVYKTCKKILKSGSKNIDKEIHNWMRMAIDYLDTNATWAFNDNNSSKMVVEIMMRKKEPIKIGRKIVGRAGNKTVVSAIWPDKWMPYLVEKIEIDEYGVAHPVGVRERVDMITNPLAIINRTIPIVLIEGSVTFILDRARKHAASIEDRDEAMEFLFDIIKILNPTEEKDLRIIYDGLTERQKKEFIQDCISIDKNGLLITNNGLYIRWETFNENYMMRDVIIKIYEKYSDIIAPYHIFVPKPKWGRDIYIGRDCIGYQYMMVLKQSGEKGFSVRSAGSISDEGLPEKSNANKASKAWKSEKPIRFGEYETPNFLVVTNPEDFALITALYRTSIDGRRWMYEAILSDDGEYNIPDNFTSRASEILQVYLKSLGIRMETVIDETEYVGEEGGDTEIIGYPIGHSIIFCTADEMYYLHKIHKVYHRYLKENPNSVDDMDELWEYIMEHLPFKKKHLTESIEELFKDNIEAFSIID